MKPNDRFFPKKGRTVVPGSLVDMAIERKRSCLVQRITILDNIEEDGLAAIARPLLISGIPTKAALVVLMAQNGNLLEPQIERTRPTIIREFHGHL